MDGFPNKVLVATDGSEDAALAVRAAIDLSGETSAELHFHVLLTDSAQEVRFERVTPI